MQEVRIGPMTVHVMRLRRIGGHAGGVEEKMAHTVDNGLHTVDLASPGIPVPQLQVEGGLALTGLHATHVGHTLGRIVWVIPWVCIGPSGSSSSSAYENLVHSMRRACQVERALHGCRMLALHLLQHCAAYRASYHCGC